MIGWNSPENYVPANAPADLGFHKVYLGGAVCKWLYVMKGRLQMEEGAICRPAICRSSGEPYAPDLALIDKATRRPMRRGVRAPRKERRKRR